MATQAKIVATGRAIVANRIKGQGTEPKYLHWGEDGGTILPLADGNTALGDPRSESRVAGTSSIETTYTTNDTYRVIATITAESAAAIKEAALFDGVGSGSPPTGGNMLVRGIFDVVTLEEGDSLQLTIDTPIKAPAL